MVTAYENIFLPVPVWSSRIGDWEPYNLEMSKKLDWPKEFHASFLPLPKYVLHQCVQFGEELEGRIFRIRLSGGLYYNSYASRIETIRKTYCNFPIFYEIDTHYQNFVVAEEDIIGAIVSVHSLLSKKGYKL